jgi:hypothetical protein
MKLPRDHRRSNRHAGSIHVVYEQVEEQKNSDIDTLAFPKRACSRDFSLSGRDSSLYVFGSLTLFEQCPQSALPHPKLGSG